MSPTLWIREIILAVGAGRRSNSIHWPVAHRPAGAGRRVLLHAGLHKTGTTVLQQFLVSAADGLRARGVLYPAAGRTGDGHHNIAWQLAGDRRFRSSAGALDDVALEISSFSGDAILSSEDFESILGTPLRFLPLLKHPSLKDHRFTIVLWVRDQASYLESLYFEMLRHRMVEEGDRFCRRALAHGQIRHEDWTFHLDYKTINAGLIQLPAQIAMRPYARLAGGSIVSDFLAFAHLDGNLDVAEEETRMNVRGSLAEALLLFYRHRLGKDTSASIESALAQLFNGKTAHLPPPLRAELIARFATGNRRVAKAYGFPASALTINPLPPACSLRLDLIFSFTTQNALADFAAKAGADSFVLRQRLTDLTNPSAGADSAAFDLPENTGPINRQDRLGD
jgi:hypothetical protein